MTASYAATADFLTPDDRVVGLTIDDESRAYRYQSHALHRLFVRYGDRESERLSAETRARIEASLRVEQLS